MTERKKRTVRPWRDSPETDRGYRRRISAAQERGEYTPPGTEPNAANPKKAARKQAASWKCSDCLRYLVEASWHPGEWVAAEDAAVRALRDLLNRKKRASLAERIALGKLVESALATRAPAVAAEIFAALAGVSERSAGAPQLGAGKIATVALHVVRGRETELDRAVEQLDRTLLGRVDFHVRGPAAAAQERGEYSPPGMKPNAANPKKIARKRAGAEDGGVVSAVRRCPDDSDGFRCGERADAFLAGSVLRGMV